MLRPMPFVAPTKTAVGFGVDVVREELDLVISLKATILVRDISFLSTGFCELIWYSFFIWKCYRKDLTVSCILR